ncbi:conjugative transfer ATPase [Pseudorhodoferax sp. Leaf267]|uniref:conjugative transfer ATPase n=1 Tax=Pseudorhodoferax sp. Leaf267 TaxID=1736316 RepID=UPI0006FE38B8|nr:conjugative transfer ATPase [Pseudorhodoferax sp. Leaf267]
MNVLDLLGVSRLLPLVQGGKSAVSPYGAASGSPAPPKGAKPGLSPVSQRRAMAMRPPSFTDLLPYVAYQRDQTFFEMKDGQTLGVLFELDCIPTEAKTPADLSQYCAKVTAALQAIPESTSSPWVVQFFVNDDHDIAHLADSWADYIADVHRLEPTRRDQIVNSDLTRAVQQDIRKHLAQVSQIAGLFLDEEVTGQPWAGQLRRVRCCIYRRFDANMAEDPRPADVQMESMAGTLEKTLGEAGVRARRCTGKDLYDWLVPFFNRDVPWARGAGELLRMAPYPGNPGVPEDESQAPILGADLSEILNFSEPQSDPDTGVFLFDGKPVRVMTLQALNRQPEDGHFTGELQNGNKFFARFDRMPPGTMLSFSITIRPQYLLQRHIEKMQHASRAQTAAAMETHAECVQVLDRMQKHDKLLPMLLVVYVGGHDLEDLESRVSSVNALLVPTGMRFIEPRQDLVPLDTFMRGLPFNFDAAFDDRLLRRSRLTFASQIASMLPVYGRTRGTPHPGMWFWNRGGEPVWIDPLNPRDRKKNAHMTVFGPTGAGKSATLCYLCISVAAIHRPRLVIVDAGKSFALLMEYFKSMGLSTHYVNLSGSAKTSLPPFVHGIKLLDDPEVMDAYREIEAGEEFVKVVVEATEIDDTGRPKEDDGDDNETDEKRDYLGEMLVAAILMITGGEKREEERMSRADRYLITRALIKAAMQARQDNRAHPLTQDVAYALMAMHQDTTLSQGRRERAEEMGQSMMSFTQGLRGSLFNRVGSDWPDVDVTLVEMGTLTRDGYGDALAVAYTSLIDAVQSLGEAKQSEGRPLVMLTDEAHMITTSDLLGPKIAKGTKMWRKLNMWFWLASQNVDDYPASMGRVLSMCEFWMLLTMDKKEIDDVSRFKSLTAEQRQLMESARKAKHQYTEGVLISANRQFLFRNVPPALPLALAMTEGDEKAHRRRLMERHQCTELEAAMLVAEEISRNRGINV